MNSAICVHFVKECFLRSAMILFTYICVFAVLIRMNRVVGGNQLIR